MLMNNDSCWGPLDSFRIGAGHQKYQGMIGRLDFQLLPASSSHFPTLTFFGGGGGGWSLGQSSVASDSVSHAYVRKLQNDQFRELLG